MRHRSFASSMREMARASARAHRAQQQAIARSQAAHQRTVRAQEVRARADAKEAARLYVASRVEEAEDLTNEVREREREIETLLTQALSKDPKIALRSGMRRFNARVFDDSQWTMLEPNSASYAPAKQGAIAKMMPGAANRYARQVEENEQRLAADRAAYEGEQRSRALALEAFKVAEASRNAEVVAHNREIEDFERSVLEGEHDAVVRYFQRAIDQSLTDEPDAESATVGYSSELRHLVIDLELPEIITVPEEASFRWLKTADRIDSTLRPVAKRKALYATLINLVSLKCVDTVFRSDPKQMVDCLTLNGMLDAVDPATGQDVRVCLLSVRVTADTFHNLNLRQVEPDQCLRSLKASVSRGPSDLLAVKPLIELDMVDPRFIATTDVLSGIDSRTNLMDLTPNEFEGLITNLFASMGLDTRQTQASRDGGVDCVAFDSRPVFGGKVVIQAKRYKNTVGVSAVRDLFGTVQNEGASKGILVTTSGYGKAAYDFARGKPLELLDGGNLLFLLTEHAKVDAKIVMPDEWRDITSHEEIK